MDRPSSRSLRLAPREDAPAGVGMWLLAALVGAGAFALFTWVSPVSPVADDAARDLLLVRDCVEQGVCHTMGAPTSVPGFRQGAIWLDLLVAVRRLGGDVEAMLAVVHVLNALAVMTLFIAARRIRSDLGLPAALVATAAIVASGVSNQLINAATTPLPDVLCAAAAALFVTRGRLSQLLVAAFAAGLAVNVHVSAGAFIPALLFLAALAGERPILQSLLAVMGVSLTAVSSSSGAWASNIAELRHRHALLLVAVAFAATAVFGALLRRRFAALSENGRLWVVAAVLMGPFGLGCLWLLLGEHREVSLHYLHPLLGPASVLVAVVLLEPLRRFTHPVARSSLVSAGLSLLVIGEAHAMAASRGPRAWSFEDSRTLAAAIEKDAWSFDELVGSVEGPVCRDVIVGLSVYLPESHAGALPPGRVLRVLPPDALDLQEPLPSPLRLSRMTDNRDFAFAAYRGWVHPEAALACRQEVGASSKMSCVVARPSSDGTPQPPLFSKRTDLSRFPLDTTAPFVASFDIPVLPDAPGEHVIELANPDPSPCGWRIVAADGVAPASALPATRIDARSPEGRSARITVAKTFGTPGCADRFAARYPPCLLETDISERALRREPHP